MAEPSLPSSSPSFSSDRRNTTPNNHGGSAATTATRTTAPSAVIVAGDVVVRGERTGSSRQSKSYINARSNLPLLLALTTVVSAFAAAMVVVTSNNSNNNSNNSNNIITGLRRTNHLDDRGLSEAVPPFVAAVSSATRRRAQQDPFAAAGDGGHNLCDLEDCQTTFGGVLCMKEDCRTAFEDELCPPTTDAGGQPKSITDIVPFWAQVLILVVLLSFSALFSGLTLGLMSLDITGLEIVMAGDDKDAARYAETIYPLRKQGNLLLCTLLLGNVAVNSIMAIFSAEMFDGMIGFLLSTFLIVIFGEIIPQALCSRYALRIGSVAVPTVNVIKMIFYVISWPLAKALDFALGRELATTYSNAEMIELLKVHVKENVIDQEEANAMTGALTYKNIQVRDAMTGMEQTFMLEVDEKLSFETIGKIFKTGYSRIPIYEISRNNIIGLLFVKDLIFLDPEDCVPVRSFIQIFGRSVHLVWPDDLLGDVLKVLKKGKSHLAVVRDVNNKNESQDPFYEIKGIITLEDIVERIIGDSIVDETDAFVDNNQSIRVERGETFEWARLRLLDTKIVDEMLSSSEIGAITAHLKTNHSECFDLLTDSQLTRLVSSTSVTTLPTATQELDKELPNDLLYEKQVSSQTFTLVLSGKVTLFVGSENFRSDVSSWSVLGTKALVDEQWAPDYSAFVSDGPCRCIQIRRSAFMEASAASAVERRRGAGSKNIAESNAVAAAAAARQSAPHHHARSSTYYWATDEKKSVTSSEDAFEDARSIDFEDARSRQDAFEDARSMASSTDGGGKAAPNRRRDVLARLFHHADSTGADYSDDEISNPGAHKLSDSSNSNIL